MFMLLLASFVGLADLAVSRARIVRAGDEARRRFERDLHDGAQQRLRCRWDWKPRSGGDRAVPAGRPARAALGPCNRTERRAGRPARAIAGPSSRGAGRGRTKSGAQLAGAAVGGSGRPAARPRHRTV